jgi:DNA polymerase III delta prime subunit
METDLLTLLTKKWENKTLGHFYILRGDEKDTTAFMDSFFKKILSNKDPSADNHPDILFLNKDPGKKQYSWDNDFSELFPFIKFAPLNLYKKIIVLSNAHLLTQDISNKILRTLEELKDAIFFFKSPNEITLLPTIESRAISLRIPKSSSQAPTNPLYSPGHFKSWLAAYPEDLPPKLKEILPSLMENFTELQNFLEGLKEDSELQMQVFNLLLAWESDHLGSYQHKLEFLEQVKRFQISLTYNNLYKERFVSLLSSCQVN